MSKIVEMKKERPIGYVLRAGTKLAAKRGRSAEYLVYEEERDRENYRVTAKIEWVTSIAEATVFEMAIMAESIAGYMHFQAHAVPVTTPKKKSK